MSFSHASSNASQKTEDVQATLTGASASQSPVIYANLSGSKSSLTMTDSGATNNALAGMSEIALAALQQGAAVNAESLKLLGDVTSREAAGSGQQVDNSNSLLQGILAANQTLAQNVQSGGATTGMDYTTKIIWAALAMVGLVVAVMLFRK
jgi:hypothetical protein